MPYFATDEVISEEDVMSQGWRQLVITTDYGEYRRNSVHDDFRFYAYKDSWFRALCVHIRWKINEFKDWVKR